MSGDYYNNFGSYLRTRGFDKTVCLLKNQIDSISLKNGGIINGILNMSNNNIINVDTIKFKNGIDFNGDVNQTLEEFFISTNGDVMFGNLDMCCNLINDVSAITFCDGTYIGTGNSFDISTNETLKINDIFIIDVSNRHIGINKQPDDTIDISGNIKLNKDIYFDDVNRLTFNNYNSNFTASKLPSVNSQPISLTRISILKNSDTQILSGGIGNEAILNLSDILINQLEFVVSNNVISKTSTDISNQIIELYSNFNIDVSANTSFSFDISSVDTTFNKSIDTKYLQTTGTHNITFGPQIIIPSEFSNSNQFVLKITNNTSNNIIILDKTIFFKSYLL